VARDQIHVAVHVENIAKYTPACRRCRKRSDQMLRDMYQPMICDTCREAIRNDYPHYVALTPVPFEQARHCLWNHERECSCWEDGVQFPDPPPTPQDGI
jgi:hypothetical protein